MRLLSAWRKLLSGDGGGTGPEGPDGPEDPDGSHRRAGILAGLTCGTVAVHVLASRAEEHLAARGEHAPGQRGHPDGNGS
ncbi:hypothetical protein [Streptomyces sp. BE147]|uniref:hypothetical protein n=1 Tax=unclassified Streptomyces TaxID=2593676 RepID=UPI002E790B20|nr:hypothetical protein [Streptomyces sp. BE147]MEE1740439.1 hypothetical protein [Streptomyces sp. BE147]